MKSLTFLNQSTVKAFSIQKKTSFDSENNIETNYELCYK